MEQSRCRTSNPVCNVCGAIGQIEDQHCRYCGAELKNCARLDSVDMTLGHQLPGKQTPVSEAYKKGTALRDQIPYNTNQPERPVSTNGQDLAMSIISVILGAVSLLFLIFSRASFLFAAAAVILGIVSLIKSRTGHGMSIIAICFGGFVILANIFWWFSSIFFMIF